MSGVLETFLTVYNFSILTFIAIVTTVSLTDSIHYMDC